MNPDSAQFDIDIEMPPDYIEGDESTSLKNEERIDWDEALITLLAPLANAYGDDKANKWIEDLAAIKDERERQLRYSEIVDLLQTQQEIQKRLHQDNRTDNTQQEEDPNSQFQAVDLDSNDNKKLRQAIEEFNVQDVAHAVNDSLSHRKNVQRNNSHIPKKVSGEKAMDILVQQDPLNTSSTVNPYENTELPTPTSLAESPTPLLSTYKKEQALLAEIERQNTAEEVIHTLTDVVIEKIESVETAFPPMPPKEAFPGISDDEYDEKFNAWKKRYKTYEASFQDVVDDIYHIPEDRRAFEQVVDEIETYQNQGWLLVGKDYISHVAEYARAAQGEYIAVVELDTHHSFSLKRENGDDITIPPKRFLAKHITPKPIYEPEILSKLFEAQDLKQFEGENTIENIIRGNELYINYIETNLPIEKEMLQNMKDQLKNDQTLTEQDKRILQQDIKNKKLFIKEAPYRIEHLKSQNNNLKNRQEKGIESPENIIPMPTEREMKRRKAKNELISSSTKKIRTLYTEANALQHSIIADFQKRTPLSVSNAEKNYITLTKLQKIIRRMESYIRSKKNESLDHELPKDATYDAFFGDPINTDLFKPFTPNGKQVRLYKIEEQEGKTQINRRFFNAKTMQWESAEQMQNQPDNTGEYFPLQQAA